MNWFKRFFKPKTTTRQFQAASGGRLNSRWTTQTPPINQILEQDLQALKARSREQAFNNPYVKKFLNACKANVIGHQGIQLQSRIKDNTDTLDKATNQLLEDSFNAWGKMGVMDVTGRYHFKSLQRLVLEAVVRDGEVLIHCIENAENPWGFALQIIECDALDIHHNARLTNGNVIRMGIELTPYGKPVAYHLRQPASPLDDHYMAGRPRYERIDAKYMLHLFEPVRPGQVRGIPWLHASLMHLKMLGGYEEAELVAARVASCKMGFFERNAEQEGYRGDAPLDEPPMMQAEPGSFEQLPNGVQFKPWEPTHPGGNVGPFLKSMLRAIASGLGVSYHSLSNDLEGVNFSSIRSGTLEERDAWIMVQQWLIEHLCEPLYEKWLRMTLLKGKLPFTMTDFERLHQGTWQGRRWPWVDPLKDLQAVQLELELGLTSIDEVIRRMGRDPTEVLDAIKHAEQQPINEKCETQDDD